jgi:hydroxypyruvate isomerase
MLFTELPYLERPGAAREAGFSTVETWWPRPGLGAEWADEVRRHGLDVALVNCDGGSIEAGERGFLNDPARRDESVQAFREAVALASRAGAPRINLLVGRELRDTPRSAQLDTAVAVVRECAALAEREGLVILIEPINELDVPGYLVPTPARAVEFVEAVGSEAVRLLYDAYHVARGGADPIVDVASWIGLVEHVHYADCPGRGAPGTGSVDLARFVDALEPAGYGGVVGLEFDPRGATLDALASVPR